MDGLVHFCGTFDFRLIRQCKYYFSFVPLEFSFSDFFYIFIPKIFWRTKQLSNLICMIYIYYGLSRSRVTGDQVERASCRQLVKVYFRPLRIGAEGLHYQLLGSHSFSPSQISRTRASTIFSCSSVMGWLDIFS